MAARNGYTLVNQNPGTAAGPEGNDLDEVEKGAIKKGYLSRTRRVISPPGALALFFCTILLGYAIIKTAVERPSNDGGGQQPGGFWGVDAPDYISPPQSQYGAFQFDEKARHRFPTVASETGISLSDAAKSNADLFGSRKAEKRYQPYLVLDKPVYRPDETIRGSCFLLNAIDNSVFSEKGQYSLTVTVKDPKGVQIASFYPSGLEKGVWDVQWKIPANVAGGEFTLTLTPQVYMQDGSVTELEHKFEVRATRVSNAKMNKKLDFSKDGYGAGDSVKVSLSVDNSGKEDSSESTTAKFIATVDSMMVAESAWVPVVKGQADFTFALPETMRRGEGTVVAKVQRGPLLESTTKTIPIITQSLDIGVFPEGGVLVRGVRQRVYVEALDSVSGKPADFVAGIYSNLDLAKPLAFIESIHEGRAVSEFFTVPSTATKVYLKLMSPSSVRGQKKDIPFRSKGSLGSSIEMVSMMNPEGSVFQHNLVVEISAAEKSSYKLGLYKKNVEIVTKEVTSATAVSSKISFDLSDNEKHYGVLRLTLMNSDGLPLAERLVFRMPPKSLEIELSSSVVDDINEIAGVQDFQSNVLSASAADGIALIVRTWMRDVDPKTGEFVGKRDPVSSIVALRVTDSSLSATVEDRLLPSRLPSAVLLEHEVDRINDAGAFLPRSSWGWHKNDKDPKGKRPSTFFERLDLLLGTQGWRAFAYYDASGFLKKGQTPLDKERLIPTGFKPEPSASGNSGSSASSSPFSPSPVPKLALQRMMGITPRQAELRFTGRFQPMFAKNAGPGRPEMVMAMAAAPPDAHMQFMDDGMRLEEDAAEGDVADFAMAAPEVPQDAAGVAGNAAFEGEEQDQDKDDRGAMLAKRAPMADQMALRYAPPPLAFSRVYAHPQRKYLKKEFEQGATRADFTETVYFNPSLETVCTKSVCEARVSFGLSEASSATFVAHADGIVPSKANTLGAAHMYIETSVPLEVDFSLPSIIVNGDRPRVPITVQTNKEQTVILKAALTPVPVLLKSKTKTFTLEESNKEGSRIYYQLTADSVVRGEQQVNLTISALAENGLKDSVQRSTVVVPRGFPASLFDGGVLKAETSKFELKLPQDFIPGTLQVIARAYTSPVGRLTKALEELIREPCGCFEQTSSTTYPLVFVLQYLKTHSGSDPNLVKKATEMLQRGYDKLVSYESPGGGFEWFGAAPGHEALTAYGLLQFAAMSDPTVGLKVDRSMIERTKKWMSSRRDGEGGFLRNQRALDSFGAAPPSTTNAYITWALVKAGLLRSRQNDPEVSTLVKRAMDSSDPYIVALAALSLFDATDRSDEQLKTATQLADRLVEMQDMNDGALRRGAEDTITRSRGDALEIEATALGVLVWLHDQVKYAANARSAVDFLASKCKNGRFSSTQATALSLMAIVEFDKAYSKPLPPGKVEFLVDTEVIESLRVGPIKTSSSVPDASKASSSATSMARSQNFPKDCVGGAVWTDCGTACPLTCEHPEPGPCTSQCVPRCQCPMNKPYENGSGLCVEKCGAISSSSTTGDADSEGVLNFSGEKILAALAGASKTTSRKIGLRLILDTPKEGEMPSIPYSLAFRYSVVTPVRSSKYTKPHPLQFSIEKPSGDDPVEGEVVTFRAHLTNNAKGEDDKDAAVPMVVAVIGIPGGFEPRTDHLRELKESKVVDFVESKPGQVIFYWRALPPKASLDIPIQVVATIPGTYDSPASRAYLFYNDEDKVWAEGFTVSIQPQKLKEGKSALSW